MKRLEAIQASPLGYAKRGDLYATARQTFRQVDGVMAPCLWPGGLAGTDDWEPVLPAVVPTPDSSQNPKPVAPEPLPKGINGGAVIEPTAPETGPVESVPVIEPAPPVVVKLGRESKRHRSGSR